MSATVMTQPDAAILAAFEKVRAHRAHVYSFDALREAEQMDEATEAGLEAADVEMLDVEGIVKATAAFTIAGVLARLQLVLPSIDQERCLDMTLMRDGLLALHQRRKMMNADAQQITSAAVDLLRLDWNLALEAYERSSTNFNAILDVKAIAEREEIACRKAGKPSKFAEEIFTKIDAFADILMDQDCAAIDRLIETPVPDWTAYQRKAEMAIKEAVSNKAGPWLLKDANALIAAQPAEARA